MGNSNKLPIILKLRKRYSLYRKVDGVIEYDEIPENIGKTSFPMVLYDFGRDKIITADKWQDLYNLSLKM